MLGEWHDGLHYLTREGQPGGVLVGCSFICSLFSLGLFLFFFFFFFIHLIKDFCVPNDFANRHAVELNINLVNKESLDNILRAKVFVHNDGQL